MLYSIENGKLGSVYAVQIQELPFGIKTRIGPVAISIARLLIAAEVPIFQFPLVGPIPIKSIPSARG